MNPDLQTVVRRNAEIIFADLDDTVVMMDPDEGSYHELDPVGARIWALLETERSVANICDALLLEYKVAPEVCRRDVLAFLRRGIELGILEGETEDG